MRSSIIPLLLPQSPFSLFVHYVYSLSTWHLTLLRAILLIIYCDIHTFDITWLFAKQQSQHLFWIINIDVSNSTHSPVQHPYPVTSTSQGVSATVWGRHTPHRQTALSRQHPAPPWRRAPWDTWRVGCRMRPSRRRRAGEAGGTLHHGMENVWTTHHEL